MKNLILSILLLSSTALVNAQEEETLKVITQDEVDPDNPTFTIVEEMPSFPGGEQELFKYLGKNIKYPKKAKKKGVEGVVYANFVVDTTGEITNVKILRGIGGGCDKETIRVIKKMPNWKPGKQRGENVRVSYNLPIRYTLKDDEKKNK